MRHSSKIKSLYVKHYDDITWILLGIIMIIIGYALFHIYLIESLTWLKILLYIVSAVLVSIAANQLAFVVERLFRKVTPPNTPFAECVLWLSFASFSFYQFYFVENSVKWISGVLLAVFLFLFLSSLGSAIYSSSFGRRRISILVGLAVIFSLNVGATLLVRDLNILTFLWPATSILMYTTYIMTEYLNNYKKLTRIESGVPILQYSGNIIPAKQISKNFKQSLMRSLPATLFVGVLSVFLFRGTIEWPITISAIYQVGITIYTVLLSILVALSILFLRGTDDETSVILKKPLLGLIQMCIVFIFLSLIGIVIGMNQPMIKTLLLNPMNLLWSGNVINNLFSLWQAVNLELMILSFTPTLMYIYGMMKLVHEGRITIPQTLE